MTTPAWTDCTTYRQGDKERIPTTFEVESGMLRIVVTNGHIHYKGQWVMHCYRLGIDTELLRGALTREQAQQHARQRVESAIAELQQDLDYIP
jgi:hypothetical protein